MSEPQSIIREARIADEAAIVALWQELMAYHAARDPYFDCCEGAAEAFAGFVRANILDERSVVVVAENAGQLIGFCQAKITPYPPVFRHAEHVMIYDMAVTEAWRHQGIGRQLVEAVKSWTIAHGIRRLELHVAVKNPIGLNFWSKMGFIAVVESRYLNLE